MDEEAVGAPEPSATIDPVMSGQVADRGASGARQKAERLERRYDVFLCHNRKDKPLVKDVADALQIEAGVLFFLDEYSIPASVEFLQYIEAEMRRSASCAIFLGPSGWGPTHLEEARLALAIQKERNDFRIIPVELPACPEEFWGTLFGAGKTPPFNWVRFQTQTDEAARSSLLEAAQGKFTTRAAGPEAVTPYYIRRQAALWERSGRKDNSLLLRGALLTAARREAAANPLFVEPVAAPFLARCEEAERNGYRRRLALAVLAACVATALSAVALVQRQEARRAASIALARSLAASAQRAVGPERDDELAILLALQAHQVDQRQGGPSASLTTAALSEALGTPFISSRLRLPEGMPASDVSASGRFVVIGSGARYLMGPVINERGRRPGSPAPVTALGDTVAHAVFDPIEEALWIVTTDGTLLKRDPARPGEPGHVVASLGGAADILSIAAHGGTATALVGESALLAVDLHSGATRRWDVSSKVRAIATSPRGDRVAVAYEDERERLDVFEAGSSVPRWSYPGDDSVNAFTFDPFTEDLIVGERGGRTWRWPPDGTRTALGSDWSGSIDTLAVSSDGRLTVAASGAITPGIQFWDASAGGERTVLPGSRGTGLLKITHDKRFVVSAGFGDEVQYWRVEGAGARRSARPETYQPFPLTGRLWAVARDPRSDTFLVGGDHGVLQAWDAPMLNKAPRVLAKARVEALSTVPDLDRFAHDGRNYLLTGHVMALSYAGDGRRFATVDPYGFALVFETDQPDRAPERIESQSIRTPTLAVALDPTGRRLAVAANATLTVVHVLGEGGESVAQTPLPLLGLSTVRALAFAGDHHLLVGNDGGRLTRWTLSDPPRSEDLLPEGPLITSVALLRDGRIVVGRGDQVDLLRRTAQGLEVTAISKGLGTPISLALSGDHRSLAVGYSDGAIRVWRLDALDRAPVMLRPHKDYVRSLTFDRAGQTLISVGDDGFIQSSVVGGDRLAEIACGLVWRDLSTDEIREYFGGLPVELPTCPGLSSPGARR